MIVGEFDPSGRPTVEGHLTLPRFGIFRTINFLVDTGADSTCIHPRDGAPARIPFDLLGGSVPSSGVGGTVTYFRELAVLEFLDVEAREIHKYELDVFIAKPEPDSRHSINRLHSLLGRDVLDRWRMVYERTDNLLEFIVRRY
ncbi:MAG: hypothetical protein F4X64_02315 [Chloroflexi bacterium]|nr:hypothetical protein [Chloroflexota bacterium]